VTRLTEATHEAGHALVAVALGLEVKLATILGDRKLRAYIELAEPEACSLRAHAMVRLASRQAHVAYGELDIPGTEIGCRQDLEEARAYALVMADGDEDGAQALLAELRAEVDDLFFERGSDLGNISIALLKHWTLTGAELRDIIATPTPFTPFEAKAEREPSGDGGAQTLSPVFALLAPRALDLEVS
jgi:hypothetical protein